MYTQIEVERAGNGDMKKVTEDYYDTGSRKVCLVSYSGLYLQTQGERSDTKERLLQTYLDRLVMKTFLTTCKPF